MAAPAARRLARRPRAPHDVTLAAYLAELHDAGRASSSASMAVAAAGFSVRSWPGSPLPPASGPPGCSPGTGGLRAIADPDRHGRSGFSDFGGRARHRPRRRGRGVESDEVALDRGRVDAVIAGLLFHGRDAAQRGERRYAGPTASTRPTATACSSPSAGARRIRRAR